jgi:hypothetical protein
LLRLLDSAFVASGRDKYRLQADCALNFPELIP